MVRRDNMGDVVDWVKKCVCSFDKPYADLVKFVYLTGLRLGEAINSFNMIVRLSREGRLNEYYNGELQCLEHFRFPEKFIREKKNVFLSFVPEGVVYEISGRRTVSHSGLKRRIAKQKLPTRLRDLRDHSATFMLYHGLLREEVDLLQGRIGRSLFMKHYFSPSLKDLRDKTLNAVNVLLSKLSP
jgi:intergrase/recombinase